MAFELHPTLAADTRLVQALPVCDLLLMNDSRYGWCILVPRVQGLRELHEVPTEQQGELTLEINAVSRALQHAYEADKMNVAALGNQVSQLHVHVIARRRDDPAWPDPVWSAPAADAPLAGAELAARAKRIREEISA